MPAKICELEKNIFDGCKFEYLNIHTKIINKLNWPLLSSCDHLAEFAFPLVKMINKKSVIYNRIRKNYRVGNNFLSTFYFPDEIEGELSKIAIEGKEKTYLNFLFEQNPFLQEVVFYPPSDHAKYFLPDLSEVEGKEGLIIKNNILIAYKGDDSEIKIPDNVEYIAPQVFMGNKKIKKIEMTDSVKGIAERAFYSCSNLEEVTLSANLQRLGAGVFAECKNLKEIILPDKLQFIGSYVFKNCYSLRKIQMPEFLKILGAGAFWACKELREIVIKGKIKKIRIYTFRDSSKLEKIVLPDSLTEIGSHAFYECSSLKEIILPNRIIALANQTFDNCTSLRKVKLPKSLEELGSYTFKGCKSLKEITLPSKIINIKGGVFAGCTSLTKINFLASSFEIKNDAFEYEYNTTCILTREQFAKLTVQTLVLIFFYNENSSINKIAEEFLAMNPDSSLKEILKILEKENKESLYLKTSNFFLANYNFIEAETLQALKNMLQKDKFAKRTLEELEKYDIENIKDRFLESGLEGKGLNEIEEFCINNFNFFLIDQFLRKRKIKDDFFAISLVRNRNSEEITSEMVLKAVLVSYMIQIEKRPRYVSEHKTAFSKLVFDPLADKVAEELNKEDLLKLLKHLIANSILDYPELIVPYARYGGLEAFEELVSKMKAWSKGYNYHGRVAAIISRGALLLNESQAALIFAEKENLLSYAAEIRGTDEDVLRDSIMSDFGFDESGKKVYDLGDREIEVLINKELKIELYDLENNKYYKNIPKSKVDPEKYELANKDLKAFKKNTKNLVKSRKILLKKEYLSGKSREAEAWKKAYLGNPVLRKFAEVLVWEQIIEGREDKTFFIVDTEGNFVDANENKVEALKNSRIAIAHPIDMPVETLFKWRKYFIEKTIAQPFTQIFEVLHQIDKERMEKRYEGLSLPIFLLKGLEKEGFNFHYYQSDYTECNISYHNSFQLEGFPERNAGYGGPTITDYDLLVTLEELSIKDNKYGNQAINLFDKVLLTSLASRNLLEDLLRLEESINEKNILSLIDTANKYESKDCLAWLIDYKEKNFNLAFDDLEL